MFFNLQSHTTDVPLSLSLSLLLAVRIGFTQTTNTVSEADTGVALTLRVLEGTIAPQQGDIRVTVSTADVTATGQL